MIACYVLCVVVLHYIYSVASDYGLNITCLIRTMPQQNCGAVCC